jgi:hypothetical protein
MGALLDRDVCVGERARVSRRHREKKSRCVDKKHAEKGRRRVLMRKWEMGLSKRPERGKGGAKAAY